MHFPTIVEISDRLPGRKRWQILRGRYPRGILSRKRYHFVRERRPGGIWGRKKHLFLRRMGYQPPAEQENTLNPARTVLRGGSGQKKVSFPARNGIPTAYQAEKDGKSCAEVTPRRFGAEKCIISCAEWVTNRLPSRKMPQIRRGRCVESARRVLRGGSGQKKGGFFEIVAAMCRSYHNFLYFCALYNLKTLKNYVTYCRLRFY